MYIRAYFEVRYIKQKKIGADLWESRILAANAWWNRARLVGGLNKTASFLVTGNYHEKSNQE